MRLIALELENFRQYAHAQVAFESGVTAIVGANGAGKTTLLEAILWALYGARALREGVDTLRFLWSQGGAKVRVQLEFELGNRRYRVKRTPTEADLAQLNSDGAWLSLARGANPVNRQVEQLLGMNHLQFQTSFCARQKELEFLGYTPQKRREEISKMLGYERVGEAAEAIAKAERELKASVEGLRYGVGDPRALQEQLQAVECALQETESALRAEQAASGASCRRARRRTRPLRRPSRSARAVPEPAAPAQPSAERPPARTAAHRGAARPLGATQGGVRALQSHQA
jgi:exonuclease SbcC